MLIAMIGIPGSGKSSIAVEISKVLHCRCYMEPSYEVWPSFVKNRNNYDIFTAMSWFRNERVIQLLKASKSSEISIIDSYYDKLFYLCKESIGLNWLISRQNPYWEAGLSLWEADFLNLPSADIVIGLNVAKNIWIDFIKRRNRSFDDFALFHKTCFYLQSPLLNSAKMVCEQSGKLYIEVTQNRSSPKIMAEMIYKDIERIIYAG